MACCSGGKPKAAAALIVGLIFLTLGIITFPVYNKVLHTELEKIVPLNNKSNSLLSWEHPSETSDAWLTFYVFDVVNPDEVLRGQKPFVQQKGPYVYDASKVREDVQFESNHTVFFRAPRTFIFNPKMSSGSENDTFTTINVPLYTIMSLLKQHPVLATVFDGLKELIKNTKLFRKLTVCDIIWGYQDNLLTLLADILKHLKHLKLPIKIDGNFGFFYKQNNTDVGLFNVHTGQDNLDKYMFISSWNHLEKLHYWNSDECNAINGTDGEAYHPFVNIDDRIYLFIATICRSVYLTFSKTVSLQGIPLYRFSLPPDFLQYSGRPDNQCFCAGRSCPHTGVLNVSVCQGGAPVFVSQPHFLNAEYYRNLVGGINPDHEKHDTYIDVEKTTGRILQGTQRIQLNIAVESIPNIIETKHMQSLLFPVIWIDQSASANSAGLKQLKTQFIYIQNGIHIAAYSLIALGSVLAVCSGVYIIIQRQKAKAKVQQTEDAAINSSSTERMPLSDDERTPLLDGERAPS